MDLKQSQGETTNEVFDAHTHVLKHLHTYANSMSLACALELRIPDVIHDHGKPMSIQELVSELNLPVHRTLHLQSLMKLLIHNNFFSLAKLDDQEDGYVLTPCSELLLSDTSSRQNMPNLLPLAKLNLSPVHIASWQSMGKWFHGSESTAFETAHGTTLWEFANQDPSFGKLFNDAMEGDSQMMGLVVKDCQEIFKDVESLVDVGGGTGLTAKILIEAFPHMTCTVYDLPRVVADMVETKNLKYVGGDMFSSIPPADSILFKSVLHNWSDDAVLKILKRCRETIRDGGDKGKVIIIDIVVDEKHDGHEIKESKLIFDVTMRLILAGRQRTEVEWNKLFLEAGFSGYKITPKFGLRSFIEVFP